MAQVIAAPSIEFLSGMDAKGAALAKLEALSEEYSAELAQQKSNQLVRDAINAYRLGDFPRSGQLAFEATTVDENNSRAFHLLAMTLERMGHPYKALVTYERAVQLAPNDPDFLIDIGMTAWRLRMGNLAVQLFERYIEARPESALGYNNLGSVLGQMGECDRALDILRNAIFRMPGEAILWNSLATVLAEEGRVSESLVFYREALRLDPSFDRLYHNLGFAFSHLGMLPEALEVYDKALECMTDPQEVLETRYSRSLCLIGMGRLEEGFSEYEVRHNDRFRAHVPHILEAQHWQGQPIEGKRLLVAAEQGLGDELMFASTLPDLQRAVGPLGKLMIAVDPRLVPLFRRSFPEAVIGTYEDRTLRDKDGDKQFRLFPFLAESGEPDFYVRMGSTFTTLRKRLEDFPRRTFLKPDPKRVDEFRTMLGHGGPTVGICWRSMMLNGKRTKYYSALDMWGPILKTPGVRFVSLQYGDCAGELARARELHSVEILEIEGLDLTNDIEGAAALSAAVDLMISAPTAAAAVAGSVGTEVWFLTAGRTWPQLGTDEYPWYRESRVFSPAKFGDWNALMPEVAAALAEYAS